MDVTAGSVAPRYCRRNQLPAQFPTTAVGVPIGAKLLFSTPRGTVD